ncbi:MAG TPA: VOC family protein [Candidatus Paceibacterota bacterium]|nr:VOC family protein [Candidatus Paceibacterota bacterium]
MTTRKDALNWFELYVSDFDRAKRFYEAILKTPLQEVPMAGCAPDGSRMAVFPYDNMKGVGGSITKINEISPGASGTIVYLNVEGDLDGVLNRIPAGGGSVVKPRMSIGEHGFIAIFKDTEGNCVGLHSLK